MSEKKKYIIEVADNVQMISLIGVNGDGAAFTITGDVCTYKTADKELKEAYLQGKHSAEQDLARAAYDEAYKQGLDDAWNAARKICNEPEDGGLPASAVVELFGRNGSILGCSAQNAINKIKAYEEQQKADSEIRVGDIITDGKINYLVIDITDKSYVALRGTDFEPAYIGKDYIKSYHNLHDSKDMQKIAEEISKAMKEGAE